MHDRKETARLAINFAKWMPTERINKMSPKQMTLAQSTIQSYPPLATIYQHSEVGRILPSE